MHSSVIIVGRKPDTPHTPDSLRDGVSYGWGSATPSSSILGTVTSPTGNEQPPMDARLDGTSQAPNGASPADRVSGFTPIIPIVGRP